MKRTETQPVVCMGALEAVPGDAALLFLLAPGSDLGLVPRRAPTALRGSRQHVLLRCGLLRSERTQ